MDVADDDDDDSWRYAKRRRLRPRAFELITPGFNLNQLSVDFFYFRNNEKILNKSGFFAIFHQLTQVGSGDRLWDGDNQTRNSFFQYVGAEAVGHPNSRSFARALNILLERHESETGVEAAVLLADKDSKFSRSFVKVLKRKNVILKTVVGSQKNAHIERVVGFDFKSLLSRLCRESGEPWPSELQRAAATWNARGGVHDSRFSPLEMYLGTSYDAFLADLLRRKPQLERGPSLTPKITSC